MGFVLRVVAGPDAGHTLAIPPSQPSRVLVGQSTSCELCLHDREVSRRHLGLDLAEGDLLRATDLGSRNGTRINGALIIEALLAGGERLTLGATTIEVHRAEQAADEPLTLATGFGRLLGASPAMRKLYPLCERLAAANVPVVIEGETGSGKEALAESLHEAGPRASGPFIVLDCAATAPTQLEAALFGLERGGETRLGALEEAHGGTLLLDEIAEIDLELQGKLLRALERGEIRRVGGRQALRVDARVLVATRRNLDQEVAAGRLREDLFYRLSAARIELPPLRRRTGDVTVLARHFWSRMARPGEPPPEDFLARLEAYGWPANVRELQNAVARRAALGDLAEEGTPAAAPPSRASQVTPDDPIATILAQELPFPRARDQALQLFEQRYVEDVLRRHGGNVARAAAASGVARRYFQVIQARTRKLSGGG
ncbi:sigma54 specific transcriptional regulator with PAS sensor, Fis family [Chondromyces apiculatus DSM 436]|uniref:Sigma54 specific transcriptional regulator with PAS sensor, Fis family n=1 Tax=Chondromyces apiculatus DSM 436 TaxID=1192034 RepID=A0A017SUX1_9BACT|nr:sigma54 specific transcriptional regulator with PAS sensor, Fis family [Chondromyces apiculatus DSM 436]